MKALKLIGKTAALTLLALVAFLLLSAIWKLLLLGVATLFGLPKETVLWFDWLILGLLFWIPKRWWRIKRPFTFSGQTDIDAPITTVWHAVDLRDRQDYFKRMYTEVRSVPEQSDCYDLIPEKAVIQGMDNVQNLRVKVVDRAPPHTLSMYHSNVEDQGGLGVGASCETYTLEALPNGGTRVYLTEVLEQLSFWVLVTLLVVSPCKDTLKSLKHVCEGTEDTSWMARNMTDITENNSAQMEANTVLIGTTACVVLTAVGVGVVFWILSMTP